MDKQYEILKIQAEIEKLTVKNGGEGNVALNGNAYHGCNPHRPNGWDCDAIQLDCSTLRYGKIQWDFEEELADASDYDWTFSESDFVQTCDEYDIDDDDERYFVLALLVDSK